jgi:hypothetical protein
MARSARGWYVLYTDVRDNKGRSPLIWLAAEEDDRRNWQTVQGKWGPAFFCSEGISYDSLVFMPQPRLEYACLNLVSARRVPNDDVVRADYSLSACSSEVQKLLSASDKLEIECEFTNTHVGEWLRATVRSSQVSVDPNGVCVLELVIDRPAGTEDEALRTSIYDVDAAGKRRCLATDLFGMIDD